MNQTPTENFVIFVALLLLYVQTSAQHYIAADHPRTDRFKGKSLYADVAHQMNPAFTAPTTLFALFHTSRDDGSTSAKLPEEVVNGMKEVELKRSREWWLVSDLSEIVTEYLPICF